MPHILIVEDEPAIADTLVYALETEGFSCTWVATAMQALAMFTPQIDGILLDVGLPDGNGFELCQAIRKRRDVPILFLTARAGEVDRVVGLEIGADDYVVKPFSPREVTARLRAVLRRYKPQAPAAFDTAAAESGRSESARKERAGLVDDPQQCRIEFRGKDLGLSHHEYRLLAVLCAHPGRVFSRQQLMNAAWESPGSALERTVDAHIKSIRARLRVLAPQEDILITHRGFGYSLKA